MQLFIFLKHLNSRKRQKSAGFLKLKKGQLKMLGGKILMNKFLRVLGLGLMMATFAFAGFAQDQTREVYMLNLLNNYKNTERIKLTSCFRLGKRIHREIQHAGLTSRKLIFPGDRNSVFRKAN